MNKEIEELQEIIDDSENIVFFGGAGVSTESNIPDFRSADGLYQRNRSSVIPSLSAIQKDFMNFTKKR